MTTCPSCNSEEIAFLGSVSKENNQAANRLWSQPTFVFIGKELARAYRIPPVIGEITGASLGYALNYYFNRYSTSPFTQTEKHYTCRNCDFIFQTN